MGSLESGDGAEAVGRLGEFDLIFADAPGEKIFKLHRTVTALREGGVIVVDDMDLCPCRKPWSGVTSGTGSGWSGRAFAMP